MVTGKISGVAVVDVERETRTLGGAGNVVNNLVALGASVAVAGVKLFPIIRTSVSGWTNGGAISFLGVKSPIGVLVVSPAV